MSFMVSLYCTNLITKAVSFGLWENMFRCTLKPIRAQNGVIACFVLSLFLVHLIHALYKFYSQDTFRVVGKLKLHATWAKIVRDTQQTVLVNLLFGGLF